MNFDFTPEQKQLGETLRRMLERERTSELCHRMFDEGAEPARGLWTRLAEMGVFGAAIPEEYGGLGASHLELCVLAEELGRALAPTPFAVSIGLGAEFILAAGDEAQKRELLPMLASGERVATFAETDAPDAPVSLAGGRLFGRKTLVTQAQLADLAVVTAAGESGPVLALVDLTDRAVKVTPLASLDPSRPVANVGFEGAPAALLPEGGDVAALIERVRDRAAVLVAFEQVGGTDRALEMARDYALERRAFGRQIGSFQALKHMMADMYVAATLARSNSYYGAWALATGSAELPAAAAAARVSATRAFDRCAADNIQVHGGMGFTWGADPQLFYRRARSLALELGGLGLWEDRLILALDAQAA